METLNEKQAVEIQDKIANCNEYENKIIDLNKELDVLKVIHSGNLFLILSLTLPYFLRGKIMI